ncbi:MAG: hypothetical protein AUG51_08290 [Acidobacteria bacterium 13_1_20CM_3_53_8]|nr:MAG: hypothetical protein AUG51_08290 [Acidobacteria bacterium 13_1_20CM_3_53_8]
MAISQADGSLTVRFIDAAPKLLLELTNTTDQTFRSVEILTVFLKDEETPGGGPSRVHIKFEAIKYLRPEEKAVLSHRTWIDGQPTDQEHDQLERLKVLEGEVKPYVLDISWEDAEGKMRFQRIPVGH